MIPCLQNYFPFRPNIERARWTCYLTQRDLMNMGNAVSSSQGLNEPHQAEYISTMNQLYYHRAQYFLCLLARLTISVSKYISSAVEILATTAIMRLYIET